MPSNIDSLLTILNTTNLQKNDPRLYQVIQGLVNNLLKTNETAGAAFAATGGGGSGGGGFVTSSIGGTANTISMFTAIRNIENVSAAAVSAALDLL